MKRILVCEDEDVIREFVVINLKRVGYEVYDVNCGKKPCGCLMLPTEILILSCWTL